MNVKLKNVRLSFPALFKPKAFDDSQDAKFSAVFLLDNVKDADQIKALKDAVRAVAKDKWADKIPKMKGTAIRACEPDGQGDYLDGYGANISIVSAASKTRVPVVDRNPSVALAEEDGKPYAGCYVNASIRLWAQDNNWGCRVNAQLLAVQFAKDGDPFGQKPVDANKEFETLEGEEGSDEDMF